MIENPSKVAIAANSTLLMYSGGLDSLGALWLLLNEGVSVHVHHVTLMTVERRWEAEQAAVELTCKWLLKNGFSFTRDGSAFKTNAYREGFLYDSDVTNLIGAGIASLSRGAVTQIAVGMTKSDDVPAVTKATERGRRVYSLFTSVPKVYPVKHLTKQQIWDMLPAELRSLSWSCRTPIVSTYQDSTTHTACGVCKTCQELAAIRSKAKELQL